MELDFEVAEIWLGPELNQDVFEILTFELNCMKNLALCGIVLKHQMMIIFFQDQLTYELVGDQVCEDNFYMIEGTGEIILNKNLLTTSDIQFNVSQYIIICLSRISCILILMLIGSYCLVWTYFTICDIQNYPKCIPNLVNSKLRK